MTGIAGLVIADGVNFTTGSIEIDLKGKSIRPSFLGVAFNVADEKTFEAVYFRPFNFKADGVFKTRAVQYIAWPKYTWNELRKNRPGKFEGAVIPMPYPDKWFHARIEIETKQVRVYINDAKEPCLTVERLAESGKNRRVGLFVDTGDGLYANFKVIPTKEPTTLLPPAWHGKWTGKLAIADQTDKPSEVPVVLKIEPIKDTREVTWTITYGDADSAPQTIFTAAEI